MRILLDECVNQKLRNHLPGHQCQSARFAGFGGIKNGELLAGAEAAGFDVLLTVDRGFQYNKISPEGKSRSSFSALNRSALKTFCLTCRLAWLASSAFGRVRSSESVPRILSSRIAHVVAIFRSI